MPKGSSNCSNRSWGVQAFKGENHEHFGRKEVYRHGSVLIGGYTITWMDRVISALIGSGLEQSFLHALASKGIIFSVFII